MGTGTECAYWTVDSGHIVLGPSIGMECAYWTVDSEDIVLGSSKYRDGMCVDRRW